DMTTLRCTWSRPVPARSGGATSRPAAPAASEASIRSIRSAKGRAASACSWARRSFAAATIFMAEVIFCVDLTLLIRFRRSLRLAMLRASEGDQGSGHGIDRDPPGETDQEKILANWS